MVKISSPWLSFSGTGSLPRSSTQHGTLPLSNWYGAYQRRNPRATSSRPMRSRPSEIIAPSRIQLRAYERVPGCRRGPMRLISMCASAVRSVSTSALALRGHLDLHAIQLVAPVARRLAPARLAASKPGAAGRSVPLQRRQPVELAALARRQAHAVQQRAEASPVGSSCRVAAQLGVARAQVGAVASARRSCPASKVRRQHCRGAAAANASRGRRRRR